MVQPASKRLVTEQRLADAVAAAVAAPADPVIAAAVNGAGSLTQSALDGRYSPVGRGAARSPILSRKVRGGNIAPKPGGFGWQGLFAEWDWANWVKPQVDRAVALGLNAVRLIGAPRCIFVDPTAGLPKITQAQYDARWVQLAAYCTAQGLYLYPCLVAKWDHVDVYGVGANFQDAAMTASVKTTAATLGKFSNVIGFDLFQEGDAGTAAAWKTSTAYALNALVNNGGNSYKVTTAGTSSSTGTGPAGTGSTVIDGTVTWAYQGRALLPADVLAMMAAVRSVANLPLTMSRSLSDGFGWNDTTSMWAAVFTATNGADFLDLHLYLDGMLPGDPDFQLAKAGKPFLIGEFGANQTQSTTAQAARFNAVAAIHNRRGVVGSFVWALADQKTSANPEDQWGVWDNTGFAGTFPNGSTAPLSVTAGRRTAMTDVLPKLSPADRVDAPYKPSNLLSPAQARPRNVTTVAASGWAPGANTYLYSEPRGLGFSTLAVGTSFVGTSPTTSVPVAAASYHRATCTLLAGVTPRAVSMSVDWYDAAGVYLVSSVAATGTDSTTVPLTLSLVVRSHTNAAYGVVVVKVTDSAQALNEAHILMDAELIPTT